MALLWYDNYEAFNTGSAITQLEPGTGGYLQVYGPDSLGAGAIINDPGYESDRSFRFHRNHNTGASARSAGKIKFFGNPDISTVIVQFRWKFDGEDNSNRTIFAIGHGDGINDYVFDYDEGPKRHVTVSRNSDNGFDIYREGGVAEGGILLIISADDLIVENTWYHLEFKVAIHELTGNFELRLNGASVAASAYQNTSNSTASSQRLCNWIEFRNNINESGSSDSDQQYIDNLVIMDTKGFRENDFQGVDYDPRFFGELPLLEIIPGSPGVPGGDPPPTQPPIPDPDPDNPNDPPGDGEDNDPGGEPGENIMPAIVGDVEWFQDFSNTIVGPNDLNIAGNRYGDDPGKLITTDNGTKPNGSQYNYKVTVNDSVLNKRVLEYQGTKEAFEKEGINHTQTGLVSERYFIEGNSGRSLTYGKAYKLSFVHNLKLGYDHDLPNNDSFNILLQLYSSHDPGDARPRNPILAYTFIDGIMNVTIRGDSPSFTEKPYQFDETYFLYNPVFNEYELIEMFFTCNHAVGTAKLQIFRNGGQVFNDQSTRIGFNDTGGFSCGMGIYHNYHSNSPEVLRRRISAIRLEAV